MSFIDLRVGGEPPEKKNPKAPQQTEKAPRPFLGMQFDCASGAYARFYKNAEGTAYTGRCPKCLKAVKIGIGSHGSSSRFFRYDCHRT